MSHLILRGRREADYLPPLSLFLRLKCFLLPSEWDQLVTPLAHKCLLMITELTSYLVHFSSRQRATNGQIPPPQNAQRFFQESNRLPSALLPLRYFAVLGLDAYPSLRLPSDRPEWRRLIINAGLWVVSGGRQGAKCRCLASRPKAESLSVLVCFVWKLLLSVSA